MTTEAMTIAQLWRAAPKGMTVAFAIAFVLLCGLGSWQLQRLHWKETLIADMARTEAAAPVPVQSLLTEAKPSWRSAALPMCSFDPRHLIYMHSELSGEPGYRVLAACPVAEGAPEMLVDLGFASEKLGALDFFGFSPVGRLRPADKPSAFAPVNNPAAQDWYTRDTAEIGKALGVTLRSDYFVVVDLAASKMDIPGLRQGPLTAPLPNRHLEYALTWFGLAFAMLGIFLSFVYQRARQATKAIPAT